MPAFPKLPPVAREPLSVVLLARDDGAHAEAVLTSWLRFLDARGVEYEIVLVEDGPSASLPQLLAKVASPRLRMIQQDSPRGEGAALRTGLQAARHPLLFYTLCKPEYRPEDLGKVLERPFVHEETDSETPPAEPGKEIDHVH